MLQFTNVIFVKGIKEKHAMAKHEEMQLQSIKF